MTRRPEPTTKIGKRLKLALNLPARERRMWTTRLMAKQEAVEAAEADLNRMIFQAWTAGMSYASIGAALGLHSTSIKDRVDAAAEGDQGSRDDSE